MAESGLDPIGEAAQGGLKPVPAIHPAGSASRQPEMVLK